MDDVRHRLPETKAWIERLFARQKVALPEKRRRWGYTWNSFYRIAGGAAKRFP